MRSRLVYAVALALSIVPALAVADDKGDCFDAAEKAQRLKDAKKLTEARPALLTCSRDVCPQQVRTDCVKWLGEVDTATSTVVVRARDADGHDIIDVKVYFDDQLLLPKLQGTAVAVDPGQHHVRYEFPNGKIVEDDVLIAEGEKDRVLRVEVKPDVPAPPTGGGEATTGHGAGPVPWIIGGVGVVALGVFIGLQADAQSTYSTLKNSCGATVPASCDPGKVSSLGTEFGVSGVFLAVAGVALVTSITWLVVTAVSGGHAKERAAAIMPRIVPGGFRF
jgi:hypothetical protein